MTYVVYDKHLDTLYGPFSDLDAALDYIDRVKGRVDPSDWRASIADRFTTRRLYAQP